MRRRKKRNMIITIFIVAIVVLLLIFSFFINKISNLSSGQLIVDYNAAKILKQQSLVRIV